MITSVLKNALLCISCSILIIGCVKEIEQQQTQDGLHEVVFHAGWAPETKTILQEDGSVWWSPGDEISLFVGENMYGGYQLTAANTEPSSFVEFKGEINSNPYNEKYVAVYPYDFSNSFYNEVLSVSVPSIQIAVKNSFANKSFISVAVSNNNNLYFKNICSGIKFSVAHDNIKKVILTPCFGSNKPIVGSIDVSNFDSETPQISTYANNSSLTIIAPDDGCFEVGTNYYVSLCPSYQENGLWVEYVTDDGNSAKVNMANPIEFKRGVFKRLYEKDKDLEFSPYHDRATTLYGFALLPESVDKTMITNVSFETNTDKTTSTTIYTDSTYPIYFELDGTTAKYYSSGEIYTLKDAVNMFSGWTSLKEINLSNIETSYVTNMSGMFSGCESLKSIAFGCISTENVENMNGMFEDCWSLESLDLSGFKTNKVTSMIGMFSGCSSLKTLNLNSFNTSNVENMSRMFGPGYATSHNIQHCQVGMTGCSSLERLDLRSFDLSKVKDLSDMFKYCYNLKELNMSGWNTDCAENLNSMFYDCASLENIDLTSFNTKNVENMGYMFCDCTSLTTLDLSNFNTPVVTDIQNMFYGCESLQILNISNFNASKLTNAMSFLCGTRNLKQLNLGIFDLSKINEIDYAFTGVASRSRSLSIKCTETTKQNIEKLFDKEYVTWVGIDEDFKELPPDVINPDMYYSNDYGMDKKVKSIQSASKGGGIDIVIMGDAYSDRLIADGTYETDMREAINAIFEVEPMKSYQQYFNVYMVYAVSQNEDYKGLTVFKLSPDGNGFTTGDVLMSNMYTKIAVHNKPFSNVATIVIGHDTNAFIGNQGTTSMSFSLSSEQYYDYGQAQWNVAYCGRWDKTVYAYTVVHEFGHLFAKLADEYITKNDTFSDKDEMQNLKYNFIHGGIYKNIDFTDDLESIRWNKFLKDSR